LGAEEKEAPQKTVILEISYGILAGFGYYSCKLATNTL